jgi:hypothetical protein
MGRLSAFLRNGRGWPAIRALGAAVFLSPAMVGGREERVDFQRDIRPILSSHCFACHGPDSEKRQAELRLDRRDDATAARQGAIRPAVVPGQPDQSELINRVRSSDPELRMPPAETGKELSANEIERLERWIAQGADYALHWAFQPPVRPSLPPVRNPAWVGNTLDAFIVARLEAEGLGPSPEADRETWLKRLTLDLTGLPPEIGDVRRFASDEDELAWQRHVDRLLASPHYGERWGQQWLDAARYADSDGFEKDKPRSVWMYRDWVVQSLNRDLPYDQFVQQQIAGDLSPSVTQDEMVATGFLRNSMLNEEGGIDPEQFRMEAMFDRMDAVGKAILGLTIQCGQCHNHKYDPLTQRDYYRMFAYLNGSHEGSVVVYTPEELDARNRIEREIDAVEDQLRAANPNWRERVARWEEAARVDQPAWEVLTLENQGDNSQRYLQQADGSYLAQGYAPTRFTAVFRAKTSLPIVRALRLEVMADPNLPAGGPGRAVNGLFALTDLKVVQMGPNIDDPPETVAIAGATADFANERAQLPLPYADRDGKRGFTGPVEYAMDGDPETAWGVDAGAGRRNVDHQAVFVFQQEIAEANEKILELHLVQSHGGWNSDDNQALNLGRFRISVTDAPGAKADRLPTSVRTLLGVPADQRTPEQWRELFRYWRTTVPQWSDANEQIERLWAAYPEGTTQLVLHERSAPRTTHRLERGDFLQPREAVAPGVPDFLHPLPEDADGSRQTLARWLVDRRSPTTARSIVNRIWQGYFGTGLVVTSEDFGTQGELPSHPELLDWLAVELMDSGWSLKRIHHLIVTSATYRQSSSMTPELLARDPDNRLLARGPRHRVDAETVRDVVLAASGLLQYRLGGPSVYPPAPDFLFQPPVSYGPKQWLTSQGALRYRRAIYTFRFRSVPYPVLQTFDAPRGVVSCVGRPRSNTPLQALTLLNEPVFVEAARSLAVLALRDGGSSDDERVRYAFERCTAREPSDDETAVLLSMLERQTERFRAPQAAPWELALSDPSQSPAIAGRVTAARLAAWTAVARVMLNLDETITKE